MLKKIVLSTLLVGTLAAADENSFKTLYDNVINALTGKHWSIGMFTGPTHENALDLLNDLANPNIPDWSLNPSVRNKGDVAKQLDGILRAQVEILGGSRLVTLKKAFDDLQGRAVQLQRQNDDLALKNVSSPGDSATTQVSANNDEIKQLRAKQKEIRGQITAELSANKLSYSTAQIDALLYTVTGTDDVDMIAVFENVRLISTTMAANMAATGGIGNLKSPNQYFGVYLLMLKTLLLMHDDYLDKVNNVYKKNLDNIVESTDEDIRKYEPRIDDTSLTAADRSTYALSVQLDHITLSAGQKYQTILDNERKRIQVSRAAVQKHHDAVESVYRATTNGAQLVALMQESQASFYRVIDLSVPDLVLLDHNEVQRFQSLTVDLAAPVNK